MGPSCRVARLPCLLGDGGEPQTLREKRPLLQSTVRGVPSPRPLRAVLGSPAATKGTSVPLREAVTLPCLKAVCP